MWLDQELYRINAIVGVAVGRAIVTHGTSLLLDNLGEDGQT